MSTVRLRLKNGHREIEVEGSKSEVDDLLRTWWTKSVESEEGAGSVGREKKPSARRRVRNTGAKQETEADQKFNAVPLANALKEDPNYPKWEKHVLHKSNVFNKIALVTSVSDEPLTSGQIATVLKALDIKADPGNISNALKKNSGKFLSSSVRRSGGSPPTYRLTSQARGDFDQWLSSVKE